MSKLPAVVCFHLKRFEHEAHATKISTKVKFPELLNLRPYLAEFISTDSTAKMEGTAPSTDDGYLYTLFAVVNHHGTLQNGHYTAFVRQAGSDGTCSPNVPLFPEQRCNS